MILLVAALPSEVAPVIRRLQRPVPLGRRLWRGGFEGLRIGVLCAGVGEVAERRARAARDRLGADALVSFGTAGALREDAPLGSAWTADSLSLDGAPHPAPRPLPGLPRAPMVTVRAAVTDPAARARWAERAALCEMEAAWVGRAAEGRPFAVVKVVSDRAGGDPDDRVLTPRFGRLRFAARAYAVCEAGLAERLLRGLPAWSGHNR